MIAYLGELYLKKGFVSPIDFPVLPITDFINGVTSYSLKPLYLGIIFGFGLLCYRRKLQK